MKPEPEALESEPLPLKLDADGFKSEYLQSEFQEICNEISGWTAPTIDRMAELWKQHGFRVTIEEVKEDSHPFEKIVAKQCVVWIDGEVEQEGKKATVRQIIWVAEMAV